MAGIVWLALSLGCDPQDDTGDASCEPDVVLGTGEDSFVPVSEGDELVMVHGPQGGWHLLGSVLMHGLGEEVYLELHVTHLESGVEVSRAYYDIDVELAEDGCTGAFTGMLLILDVLDLAKGDMDTPPELLADEVLRIDLLAEGEDGTTFERSVEIVAVPDPADL